jgi:hypothetical protein
VRNMRSLGQPLLPLDQMLLFQRQQHLLYWPPQDGQTSTGMMSRHSSVKKKKKKKPTSNLDVKSPPFSPHVPSFFTPPNGPLVMSPVQPKKAKHRWKNKKASRRAAEKGAPSAAEVVPDAVSGSTDAGQDLWALDL